MNSYDKVPTYAVSGNRGFQRNRNRGILREETVCRLEDHRTMGRSAGNQAIPRRSHLALLSLAEISVAASSLVVAPLMEWLTRVLATRALAL